MWISVFVLLVLIAGVLLFVDRRRRSAARPGYGRRLLIGLGAALPFLLGRLVFGERGLDAASVVLILGIAVAAATLVHLGERITGRT